ncbi:hypothetical protein EZV61_17910 [Corallincola luteus]|uniref:Cell division inhibitor n=1 Tax=Corallincola luteus TaxID=1775177 RepID=A0ABY2AFZ5_9GAMM|nr:hypothetical protein [Corallincola luteus]TCI01407.1 hypothetical protein EZV61_17910 [Corallincola luteus]
MNPFETMNLHTRQMTGSLVAAPQPKLTGNRRLQNKWQSRAQIVPVEGQQSALLETIKRSQQANKWVVLVAAPDKQVTRWLVENGVCAERLLQVHPKDEQGVMCAVTQGLGSATCGLVIGWTDLLSEAQWQALTAEAACYDTNSVLFHRMNNRCHAGRAWQSARSKNQMFASVLVH